MSKQELIGRVIATESKPTTTTELRFWVDDTTLLRPFDVVKIPHLSRDPDRKSYTYAIVQELEHLTDAIGYLSGVVSSDFGDVNIEPRNIRLGTTVATAEVLYNTEEIEMPVRDGSPVMWADQEGVTEALGLRGIKNPLPAGYFSMSNGVEIPINFEGDFVVGPEGAHVNISGISGLATKTSYAMFLMSALQQTRREDISLVIFNVKGNDLLSIDRPNADLAEHEKEEWRKCGLEPLPFDKVTYFYPYSGNKSRLCTQSTVPKEVLEDQISRGAAHNYFYDVDNGKKKLELLFADVDDSNATLEQCVEQVREKEVGSWGALIEEVEEMTKKLQDRKTPAKGQEIPVVSWRRFYRFLQQRVKNDIFDEETRADQDVRRKVHAGKIVKHIKPGQVVVVDIQPLPDYLQSLVFGDVIRQIQSAKMGGDDETDYIGDLGRVVIFADELNKYAPQRDGSNDHALTRTILEITERGRSLGVVLFGAEQFRSGVHKRVLGNCSTNIMGRTNSVEVSSSGDFRFLTAAQKAALTRLPKGTLLLQHAAFSTSTIKARFPVPAYFQPK